MKELKEIQSQIDSINSLIDNINQNAIMFGEKDSDIIELSRALKQRDVLYKRLKKIIEQACVKNY